METEDCCKDFHNEKISEQTECFDKNNLPRNHLQRNTLMNQSKKNVGEVHKLINEVRSSQII